MKKVLMGLFFSVLMLCGIGVAQDATPQQPESTGAQEQQEQQNSSANPATQPGKPVASASPLLAPGSVIPVQLTKSIDAKKAKSGDAVEARVTQDLKNSGGTIIVPKDTKVIGHVAQAQARTKEQKESQIAIAFDHAVMNGSEVAVPLSIQAIIAPQGLNSESNNNGGESVGQTTSAPRGGGMSPGGSGGRPMSSGAPQPAPSSAAGEESPNPQSPNTHEPITANTQGVVGISNLKLEAAANATQGSVLSSEKNNVKVESGTLILLRVNP